MVRVLHVSCWFIACLIFHCLVIQIWATSWQSQQNDLCTQWRLRSAWVSAQSDQSLLSCSAGSLGPKLSSYRQQRLWSDWADAQTDLSLCWAHLPFCWLCDEAANFESVWVFRLIWTTSSEFGTYSLCEQRRFRRACASTQSRQNLRCSLI